jgi:hypothetical protein
MWVTRTHKVVHTLTFYSPKKSLFNAIYGLLRHEVLHFSMPSTDCWGMQCYTWPPMRVAFQGEVTWVSVYPNPRSSCCYILAFTSPLTTVLCIPQSRLLLYNGLYKPLTAVVCIPTLLFSVVALVIAYTYIYIYIYMYIFICI